MIFVHICISEGDCGDSLLCKINFIVFVAYRYK